MCSTRGLLSRWVNPSSSLSTAYDNNTCKHIAFELNDKDVIDANNLGLFSISINDILNNKYVNYSYAYVYGASESNSDVAMQMILVNDDNETLWFND